MASTIVSTKMQCYDPEILPGFQKRIAENNSPAEDLASELARERSREAADRTLMAWIRTVLTLIGFGFAIASFREVPP